jgi:hypothetical protein
MWSVLTCQPPSHPTFASWDNQPALKSVSIEAWEGKKEIEDGSESKYVNLSEFAKHKVVCDQNLFTLTRSYVQFKW